MATHNFDYNQPNTFGGAGGIIDINPVYSNILMVADHGQGSVVIYNITSGTNIYTRHLQTDESLSCYLCMHLTIFIIK